MSRDSSRRTSSRKPLPRYVHHRSRTYLFHVRLTIVEIRRAKNRWTDIGVVNGRSSGSRVQNETGSSPPFTGIHRPFPRENAIEREPIVETRSNQTVVEVIGIESLAHQLDSHRSSVRSSMAVFLCFSRHVSRRMKNKLIAIIENPGRQLSSDSSSCSRCLFAVHVPCASIRIR